jgi:predicted transcriptional regulator
MSSIIRIAVLCLLLVAIPCIAAASDSTDNDHGYDTGDASGLDKPAGDSRVTRDSGRQNTNREINLPSRQNNPEQKDIVPAKDALPSREDSKGSSMKESGKDSSADAGDAARGESLKTVSPAEKGEKNHSDSGDKRQSADTLDITSEKSDREMHNDDSEKDLSGLNENQRRETEGKDTSGINQRIVRNLHDSNEVLTSNSDDEKPFAQRPVHRDTRTAAGSPPAPQIPEPVPYNDVPFACIPALPAGCLPFSTLTSSPDGTRPIVRNKNKGEHEPFWNPTDSTFVLSPLMLLKLWCFLGFRRVLRKNVLENDERKSLYDSIAEHPGVDISRLTEMLKLNKETARYHLKMLAVNGKIIGLIKQGIARYFPSCKMISEFEKTVIHYLWIATTKRILLLLIETPGLTRQAIARELGIAGPSVTWQMQRLADDGLIEMHTEGKFVRYFLTPGSVDVLESVKKSDGQIGHGSLIN